MALATANANYRRVGPGLLYIVSAPTTGIVDQNDYYALFTTGDKQVVKTGLKPWANLDSAGLHIQIKTSKVKFDPNVGPVTEMVTGIDSASVEFTYFDVDAAHLNDLFGDQAGDLITVAAATGVAARKVGLLGPQSYNVLHSACYRMPSSEVPGTFRHYIFPLCSMIGDLDLKLSKKDAVTMKVSLQLMCSPYVLNSAGFGAVLITDDPTAPALP